MTSGSDAASLPQLRGSQDTANRRLWTVLGVSLVVHVAVFTPLGAVLGLLGWLLTESAPPDLGEEEALNAIPIELLESPEPDDSVPEGPKTQPAAEPAVENAPPKAPPVVEAPKTPEPALPKPEPKAKPKETEEKRPPKGIADPTALSGEAAKLADSNANVRLLVLNHKIRGHVLGERIGAVLGILPQWHSFLGGTDIDPVQDLDRILIAGPQLRRTGDVLAVLEYNVKTRRVREAIDQLVRRSPKGKWLDAPFPLARARADRADRLFGLPRAKVAVVSPVALEQQLLKIGPKLNFPKAKGDEALVAYIKTPWRVFIGRDFDLPKSIAWMRLRVTPKQNGGVLLEVEAEDESEELAKKNARLVSRQVNSLAQMGGFGAFLAGFGFQPFVDRVALKSEGKKIEGSLLVKPRQLKRILNTVEVWIEAQTGRSLRPMPKPVASGAVGTVPPGAGGAAVKVPGPRGSAGRTGNRPSPPATPTRPSAAPPRTPAAPGP